MRALFPAEEETSALSGLERLARQMPGGFFIYRADESKELVFVNDVTLEIFGCADWEEFRALTGGTFRGMVHPSDLDAVEESIQDQIRESRRQLDYVEYRIIQRDGSIRWVDDYGRLVDTEEYGPVFFVFLRDVTDIRAVRLEAERKAEVIEGLSVDFTSIYLINLETGSMRPYRLQNEDFRGIAATLAAETDGDEPDWRRILPAYAARFVIPEDRDLFLRETGEGRIRDRLDAERSYALNYRVRSGNDIRYMEMSAVLIHSGQSRHAVMGFRDVTEATLRVQREGAERLKTEMDLEREKRANEIKSSFLFNISHDIRTPMNAIKGFTDLALRSIQDPVRLENYLSKVDEANTQLLALIDDILEMSRMDCGRVELKAEPCALREQLDLTLDLFRAQAEQKKLSLVEYIDLPEGNVLVDANRFRRVMSNLLSNAVKFTPSGGTITVGARQKQISDSGYARFEFTVSDTGVGMSDEFMKRIYQAFEREESSTRAGTVGTGLGLAITKNLLDLMGGSIAVDSRKGKGTTFTVNLPLKLEDHTAPDAPPVEETQYKADGTFRILLVEDIETNRMLAETILEDAGFLVESVPDGSDAVEAVRNHSPWYYDLVLMDIQMPVMNGYEATRSIRALGRKDTDTIPIIALSANARDEDKRMSMESGMNNHVAKPFDIAHLIGLINEYIANREMPTD